VPPGGKPIVTLSDARAYLLALPKSRHNEPVATAIEAVLRVVDKTAMPRGGARSDIIYWAVQHEMMLDSIATGRQTL
jgi:hypothetical protein